MAKLYGEAQEDVLFGFPMNSQATEARALSQDDTQRTDVLIDCSVIPKSCHA